MVVTPDLIVSLSKKALAPQSRDFIIAQLRRRSAIHMLTHTITSEGDPGSFALFSRNNRFLR